MEVRGTLYILKDIREYGVKAKLQRLRMLGFETPPPPLSSAARLRVPRRREI